MDHLITGAQASARAIQQVVLPALRDSGDTPAFEQAQLVRDFLEFVADRVHLVAARQAFQRRHAITLADAVLDAVNSAGGAAAERLAALCDSGMPLVPVRNEGVRGTDVAEEVDTIYRAVTDVVREAAEHAANDLSATDGYHHLQRLVVEQMKARVEVDRAWLAPMGFDPEPATIGDLATLLAT